MQALLDTDTFNLLPAPDCMGSSFWTCDKVLYSRTWDFSPSVGPIEIKHVLHIATIYIYIRGIAIWSHHTIPPYRSRYSTVTMHT